MRLSKSLGLEREREVDVVGERTDCDQPGDERAMPGPPTPPTCQQLHFPLEEFGKNFANCHRKSFRQIAVRNWQKIEKQSLN